MGGSLAATLLGQVPLRVQVPPRPRGRKPRRGPIVDCGVDGAAVGLVRDDGILAKLVRALPPGICEEHIRMYRARPTAVGETSQTKLTITHPVSLATRNAVASRFHTYCLTNDIDPTKRKPRGCVKKFIADIWNRGELDLIPDVVSPSLRFNG